MVLGGVLRDAGPSSHGGLADVRKTRPLGGCVETGHRTFTRLNLHSKESPAVSRSETTREPKGFPHLAGRVVGSRRRLEDSFSMAGAFAWGLLAASSLILGACVALQVRIRLRTVGLIMGCGAGRPAQRGRVRPHRRSGRQSLGDGATLLGIFAGCGVFFGGDLLIDRAGGERRKSPHGPQQDESALAIVLGTVLDGIPESLVIGLTIYESGTIGAAYLAAVFISNVPEAISSTTGLAASGWRARRILGMWTLIALVSGLSSLLGYVAFRHASPDAIAFTLAFAAGAILTMLADTMMPEAYKHGGKLAGVVTTLGFAVAFLIDQLDSAARARLTGLLQGE